METTAPEIRHRRALAASLEARGSQRASELACVASSIAAPSGTRVTVALLAPEPPEATPLRRPMPRSPQSLNLRGWSVRLAVGR